MNCPEIEKIATESLGELDEPTRAHIAACPRCLERRDKLARLLAFPAAEPPPPDVHPRVLARLDDRVAREVARPARPVRRRALVAAVFAFALVGSFGVFALTSSEARAREQRLDAIVVESECLAFGCANETELHTTPSQTTGGTK
jgi:hypothetical protein